MGRIKENNFHSINIIALATVCQAVQFTESNTVWIILDDGSHASEVNGKSREVLPLHRLFHLKYHLSLNQMQLAIADVHTRQVEICANKASVWYTAIAFGLSFSKLTIVKTEFSICWPVLSTMVAFTEMIIRVIDALFQFEVFSNCNSFQICSHINKVYG